MHVYVWPAMNTSTTIKDARLLHVVIALYRVLDTSCKTTSCGPLRDRSLRAGHFVIGHFVIGHFVRSLREVSFVIGSFVEATS